MAFDPLHHLTQLRDRVFIAHHIPGRIRLRFKSSVIGYLAGLQLGELKQLVEEFPALTHYKVNVATGSVLLEYDRKAIDPKLLDAVFHSDEQHAHQACIELLETLTRIHHNGA